MNSSRIRSGRVLLNVESDSVFSRKCLNLILLFFSFLSGVCVGLSILCLIVVAITIGYKSETHYRLDNGNGGRKRIRLIKASSNESSSSSNSSGSEGDATSTDGENRSGIFNFKKDF